ncbi:MAG: radical SAM protein [Candidatus Desulfofervidus auxilii]|nr:radical SAM protein [Candidatus Desulfofervidus auxilii]
MNWLNRDLILQIEPTRKCNLNCKICMRQNLNKKNVQLSFENFKKVLNFGNFRHVCLHGWGEPLLNSQIFQMIEYAESQGISTELTTNGTLLKENLEKIFDSGLSIIVFGIHNKKILLSIFPQIKELIEKRNKERLKKPKIYMDIVIYKENLNQILDLIKITSQLNIDAIVLHRLFKVHPNVNYISVKEERELFKKAKKLAKELKIKLYLPPKPSIPCVAVRYSIFVTVEGKITPCPYLLELYLGNVFNHDDTKNIYLKKINFIKNMNKNPICNNKCPLGSRNGKFYC